MRPHAKNDHNNIWVAQRSTQGISGEFRSLLRIAPPSNPHRGFAPPSVNTILGPLNVFAFASLARAATARYNQAMNTSLFDQVRQLSVEEQIELVEALWDNIVERNAVPGPTEAQKAELDRRLSEHAAHPDDVVPWSEVKDSALARIRR
jgi:putative addiction module component (TIGR02574 family)